MTHSACGFAGDREEALVTYLYGEPDDAAARTRFEAHLATCVACRQDLAELEEVRAQIGHWNPPRFASMLESGAGSGAPWWRQVPAWAQVAAALLFLGVAAGIANLDVRYDQSGLSVRTGWSQPPRAVAQTASALAVSPSAAARDLSTLNPPTGDAPWRTDLAALERQLRTEFRGRDAIAQPARASVDADTLRRVRALIDESEKRQQRELALRLAEAIRDVNAQRQADLVRVDRALGSMQNNLGVQVLKNRQQMQQMDFLIRTSQRQ